MARFERLVHALERLDGKLEVGGVRGEETRGGGVPREEGGEDTEETSGLGEGAV